MSQDANGQDQSVEEEVGTLQELQSGRASLEAVDRAAIDIQVSTAKEYPRSVDRSLKEALTLATMDEDTAASMFYSLPRGGKTIEGPSARLAEIMAYTWGNIRADADIVDETSTHVTAMGTCVDLEKNVAVRVRVTRRITDAKGRRYNEDMIAVTKNAAISVALRNAVFKVVPRTLVDRIYHTARKASLGEGGTIAQKRQKSMAWFQKLGVKDEQVFELLGVGGLDDIGEEELIKLRGLATAIKDGEATVEQVFHPPKHSEETEGLNEDLREKGAPEDEGSDDDGELPLDDPRPATTGMEPGE